MKNYYIKPELNDVISVDNVTLMSASVNPSKQSIIHFTPDVIPDAEEGVEAS